MKILVVDDDSRIVKTTCDILKIKGHSTTSAYSGEDGLAKVLAERPDCVLMDIKMRGMDGVETTKRMKQIAPVLPIVLVSAYATDEVVGEAEKAGAFAVLSKPLNFPGILSFLAFLQMEESILVVDDDANFSKTLKEILTLSGYRVQTESEPQNVLGHLEAEKKLAVLLDLNLGAQSSVEILENIRAKYPTMPVLVLTGHHSEMDESLEKVRQIGAHTCLYKPLEVEEMLHLLEDIRLRNAKPLLTLTKPTI